MAHPRSFTFLASLVSLTALAVACKSKFEADDDKYCQEAGNCPGGRGGNSGGGNGDGGSAADMGSGGSGGGVQGSGGGGTGGGPAECRDDTGCMAKGPGSLCVEGACTASSDTCVKAKRVVIDDDAPRAPVVANDAFADACYYKTLDDALVSPQNDMHVIVTAEAVSVGAPLTIDRDGVTLEGQSPQAGQPVLLTVLLNQGQPHLTLMGSNVRLKGFALDGTNNAPGVAVAAGSARLEGPFVLQRFTLALSVESGAKATVVGTEAAPVTITENARGVFVGGTAELTMTGEGGASVVVEKTSAGAGMLVAAGDNMVPVTIKGVVFRGNTTGGGPNGVGAFETRPGRQVLLEGCTFEKNQRSVTLNAQNTNDATIFLSVKISGNDFSNALPGVDQGAVVCGSEFLATSTKIQLEPLANTFPTTKTACATIVPAANCFSGVEVGYDVAGKAPTLVCPTGLAQRGLAPSRPAPPPAP